MAGAHCIEPSFSKTVPRFEKSLVFLKKSVILKKSKFGISKKSVHVRTMNK